MRIAFGVMGLGVGAANGWLLAGPLVPPSLGSALVATVALRLLFNATFGAAGGLVGLILDRARKG
jgi:hypothetical protein